MSRAANIDKAGPPPSLPSSGAHKSPEKEGGASPKHQWKREWAGSHLGAGGGACPAGPMRTRGGGRLLGREGRRMADAALFEFLHTEMVAELWAQDPDPGPGVSAGPRGEGGTGRGGKAGSRPREEQRARQRPGSDPRPAPASLGDIRRQLPPLQSGVAAGPASRVSARTERDSSGSDS